MNSNPPAQPEDGRDADPAAVEVQAHGTLSVGLAAAARAELKLTKDRAAALATEMRTLKERLVMLRARTAALEHQVRIQNDELEKYHHVVEYISEGMRRSLGQVLYERGRWLLREYQQRGLRGRVKLVPRFSEFLEFQALFAALIHPHPDWPQVHARLEQVRGRRWYRQLLDVQGYRRTLRNLLARLRKAG